MTDLSVSSTKASFAKVSDPALGVSLLTLPPEAPWHDGTSAYIRANRPVIRSDVIGLAQNTIALLGAVGGSLVFVITWLIQRINSYRRQSFENYMERIAKIERKALEIESSAQFDMAELLALRRQLGELKSDAIEQFAKGALMGEQLVTGFLIHVNDVRDYLSSLMLHELDRTQNKNERHD